MIRLHARQFRATQAARATNLDPFRAEILRRLQRFFHRAPERHPAFELQRDVFRDQLRLDLRRLDLDDVHIDFLAGHLAHLFLELVNFRAFAANDHARTRGENGDAATVRRALDQNPRHGGRFEFLLQQLADFAVFAQQLAEFLLLGIPL